MTILAVAIKTLYFIGEAKLIEDGTGNLNDVFINKDAAVMALGEIPHVGAHDTGVEMIALFVLIL